MVDKRLNKNLGTSNNSNKSIKAVSSRGRSFIAENKEIIQGIREIRNDVKEIKKFMVMNNLRCLVDNYDKITQTKQKKLEKEWELASKDKKRNKEIAEWDRIQAEDEENSSN